MPAVRVASYICLSDTGRAVSETKDHVGKERGPLLRAYLAFPFFLSCLGKRGTCGLFFAQRVYRPRTVPLLNKRVTRKQELLEEETFPPCLESRRCLLAGRIIFSHASAVRKRKYREYRYYTWRAVGVRFLPIVFSLWLFARPLRPLSRRGAAKAKELTFRTQRLAAFRASSHQDRTTTRRESVGAERCFRLYSCGLT